MVTKVPASPPVSAVCDGLPWRSGWWDEPIGSWLGAVLGQEPSSRSVQRAALPWEGHGPCTGITRSKASTSTAASFFMHHLPLCALLTANIHDNGNGKSSTGEVRCTEESTGPKCGLTFTRTY